MNGGVAYPGAGFSGGGGGGYFGGGAGSALGVGAGGGGASYPAPASQWDTKAMPSVAITISDFYIFTSSLPPATPGTSYGPVTLQAANVGVSTSPKWKKVTLAKGLKLSSVGVLSGTPSAKLAAPTSVTVSATETVATLNGKKKIKTKTTVQATIPFA